MRRVIQNSTGLETNNIPAMEEKTLEAAAMSITNDDLRKWNMLPVNSPFASSVCSTLVCVDIRNGRFSKTHVGGKRNHHRHKWDEIAMKT